MLGRSPDEIKRVGVLAALAIVDVDLGGAAVMARAIDQLLSSASAGCFHPEGYGLLGHRAGALKPLPLRIPPRQLFESGGTALDLHNGGARDYHLHCTLAGLAARNAGGQRGGAFVLVRESRIAR